MLSKIELDEIETELAHLPSLRAGCIDALKIVQRHRGWVSDEALEDVADVLDVSPAELENVATFYNLIFRRPIGEHVILVCDSISCWLTGGVSAADALKSELGIGFGETTPDGKFTLLPTVCLGHCEQAPVMMLDGEIIGNLTNDKIREALRRARGD